MAAIEQVAGGEQSDDSAHSRRRSELGARAAACQDTENTDHALIRQMEIEAWAFRAYTRAVVSSIPLGQIGRHGRVAFAVDELCEHGPSGDPGDARPETPEMSVATEDSLMPASSKSFPSRRIYRSR